MIQMCMFILKYLKLNLTTCLINSPSCRSTQTLLSVYGPLDQLWVESGQPTSSKKGP